MRAAPSVSILVLAVLALAGCGRFAPEPLAQAGFFGRAATQESEDLRVHVSALSAEESRRYLGLELASHGVQPIWMKIENRTDSPVWFVPIATDPSYFAPFEVAYMFHRVFAGKRNQAIDELLLSTAMPLEVPPRGVSQGFVYTHAGEGARYVPVEVLSDGQVRSFRFIAEVPGGTVGLREDRLRGALSEVRGEGPRPARAARGDREAPLLRPERRGDGGRRSAQPRGGGGSPRRPLPVRGAGLEPHRALHRGLGLEDGEGLPPRHAATSPRP